MAVTLTNSQLSAGLYSAFWNRAPDATGQNFWVGNLNAGTPVLTVATAFYNAPEGLAAYPNWIRNDPAALVTQVYTSVFNRAPDAGGLAFYVAQINAGTSFPQVVLNMMYNALNAGNSDGAQFANEIQVGIYVSEVLRTDDPFITGQALEGVTADPASVTAREAQLAQMAAQTFTLTTGIDAPGVGAFALTSPTGNSNVYGSFGAATGDTLTPGDNIRATGLNNTLTLADLGGADLNTLPVTVTGVQTLNVQAAGDTVVNTTSLVQQWTGLNQINVTSTTNGARDIITAATTTNVTVTDQGAVVGTSGVEVVSANAVNVTEVGVGGVIVGKGVVGAVNVNVTGKGASTVLVDGGSSATVTTTQNGTVKIGDTTAATGAVSITETSSAESGVIEVQGGTTVAVTATSVGAAGVINIGTGGDAADLATGAITVTENIIGSKIADTKAGGTITVKGGSTITVTENVTSPVNTATAAGVANKTVTQSAVTIDSTTATSATVNQAAAVAAVPSQLAVAGVNLVDTITFSAVAAGGTVTVNGLTFTATAAITAAQAAAAFSGLSVGATQGASILGTYSGTFATAAFTTGIASGATLSATGAAVTGTNNITVAASGTAPTVAVATAAVTPVVATDGVGGVATAVDSITGAKIATATLNNYATATVVSDALTKLNLTGGSDVTVTNTKATSLTLNADNVHSATPGAAAKIGLGNVYTSLTVNASDLDLLNVTAGGVAALTLNANAGAVVDASASTMGALKTVSISGAGNVALGALGAAATVTSIDASQSTGNVSTSLDAAKATFVGSSGADTVVLTNATITKNVKLGAGDDYLHLATGTTTASVNGTLEGGLGVNTLGLAASDAAALSASGVFALSLNNFQKLDIDAAAATKTVDLANLDAISDVTVHGETVTNTLTLNNLANNGTVTLAGTGVGVATDYLGSVAVNLAGAGSASDVLNLTIVDNSGLGIVIDPTNNHQINANVTADTDYDVVNIHTVLQIGSPQANSIALTALAPTVNVDGDANLTLTYTDAALALIDASTMTGGLTASATNANAVIQGGLGGDVLTAAGAGSAVFGGLGNDTLIATGASAHLTGGVGSDTFNIGHVNTDLSTVAVATDVTVGDTLYLQTATSFKAAAVDVSAAANLQGAVNLAMAAVQAANSVAWFSYGDNTFVVENVDGNATYTAGTDVVVQLTGAVDLSHGSFSTTAHTIAVL